MIRHGMSRTIVATKGVDSLPNRSFVLWICPPVSSSFWQQQQRHEFHVSRSVCSKPVDSSNGVDVDFYRTQLKERKRAFNKQQPPIDKKPPRGTMTMTRTRRGFEKNSASTRSATSYSPSKQVGVFSSVDTTKHDYEITHKKRRPDRTSVATTQSTRQHATFQRTPTRGNKARTRHALNQTQKASPVAQKSRRPSSARNITKASCKASASLSNNNEPTPLPSSWPSTTLNVFISCLPGLEPILSAELAALGGFPHKTPKDKRGGGGILTEAPSLTKLMECHLHLGTASHILLRCGEPFSARGWAELHRKLVRMPWHLVLQPNVELDVRATSSKSKLYHTEAIAERVSKAIYESLGRHDDDDDGTTDATVEEEQPQLENNSNSSNDNVVRLLVRVHRDTVQVSIDTSLTPLHQRGYRFETAKAPLREDLAFALLHAVGWTPRSHLSRLDSSWSSPYKALLDPFCGSGTIAIEGAAMLAGLPPGRLRPPPLAGTQLYDQSAWEKLKEDSFTPLTSDVLVAASDRNSGAVEAARSNAKRAGVLEQIDFSVSALASHPWWDHAQDDENSLLVATNPPYGKRISSSQQKDGVLRLYQALGQQILSKEGIVAAILAKDVNLVRKTGLPVKAAFTAPHGGIPVSAMVSRNGR